VLWVVESWKFWGGEMAYARSDLRYIGPGENVFMFVPNLIGYARVVRTTISPSLAALPLSSFSLRLRPFAMPRLGRRLQSLHFTI